MSMTSGGLSATTTYVEQHDQALLYVSGISDNFASATVIFNLQGTYKSDITAKTMTYYDYGSLQQVDVSITATTEGFYEFPYAGGVSFLNLVANTATCQTVILRLILPKISY